MSKDCSAVCTCTPGRLVDPLGLTPFPVANFPPAGDDNRFSVLLGDDGNLYVSNGVQWNAVGGGSVVPGSAFQAFRVTIQNNGGTLQHQIRALNSGTDDPSGLVSGITGASATFTNTPNGTNATTPFAAGLKISSDFNSVVIFDNTVAQEVPILAMQSVFYRSDTGDLLHADPTISDTDVNGVTRIRLQVVFRVQATGALFDLNTTNITSGQFVQFGVSGFMKV